MDDGRDGSTQGGSLDELIDRAVAAINRGDRAEAATLAGQVLTADRDNADASDLLDAPKDAGEIRRLSMLFADLVDSTTLSQASAQLRRTSATDLWWAGTARYRCFAIAGHTQSRAR